MWLEVVISKSWISLTFQRENSSFEGEILLGGWSQKPRNEQSSVSCPRNQIKPWKLKKKKKKKNRFFTVWATREAQWLFFFFFFFCSEFCHTLKWKGLGFTCLPHPDPPSHLPPHPLPPGPPSGSLGLLKLYRIIGGKYFRRGKNIYCLKHVTLNGLNVCFLLSELFCVEWKESVSQRKICLKTCS